MGISHDFRICVGLTRSHLEPLVSWSIGASAVQSGCLFRSSQQYLASEARIGIVTVHQLEAGISRLCHATLDVIRRAFEVAGIEFIDENGGGSTPSNGGCRLLALFGQSPRRTIYDAIGLTTDNGRR
jgi:hypothetical protein